MAPSGPPNLGSPTCPDTRLRTAVTGEPTRFYELWWVAAALCAAGAVTSIGLTPKRHPANAESHPPHAASTAAVEP